VPASLPLRHALLLGLTQGPTEVLPVSSSAHIALLPRLAGWSVADGDPELRNSLEVALHASAAAALVFALRCELAQSAREVDGRWLAAGALALAPSALVGYLLERRPERRPSSPRALAVGLALGGAAMAWADTHPGGLVGQESAADARGLPWTRGLSGTRGLADVCAADGLTLGLAQALALLPGVSRNGAALTAARARGFAREDAHALSWRVGLPVLAGAAALKAVRLGQRGVPPGANSALALGAAAACASTLASAPLLRCGARGRALWPLSLYRAGLALVAAVDDRTS
jgi:undecaprenyl-diphosphatase